MSKKEKGERIGLARRLCRGLDITPDVLPHGTTVILRGRAALSVSGCEKILTYTPQKIVISLHRDTLWVRGRELLCTCYHAGEIGIEGVIDSMGFCGEDE